MFRVTVALLCYFLVAESIKVPTSWDNLDQHVPKPHIKPRSAQKSSQARNYQSFGSKKESLEIPTRPIYPGKGVWAKPASFKHRPFVREDYLTTYPPLQVDDYQPDGYSIYTKGLKNFNKIRSKLNQNNPKHIKLNKEEILPQSSETNENFIPKRLYSQVRKSEQEDHLPFNEEEPRLREVIKDSRIHIVYTEEGYEDGEYDHGDREKSAENHEGFQQNKNHDDNAHDGSSTFGKRIKFYPKRTKATNHKKDTLQKIDDKTAQLIMADINKHIKRSKRSTLQEKYPYYNNTDVPINSPLRYALNLNDIPRKKQNEFVIFNQNDKPCEEPPNDINPIPERVEKGEAKDEKEKDPDLPRLKNLGDKIDCFKNKYFGEQPLDNPIFKEELIAAPTPIFTTRQAKNLQSENSTSEDTPEASELRMRRRRRRPIKRQNIYSMKYQPSPLINVFTTTPTYPNRYTISEVFYKDDIKPNEQLNVFADVINNIKNSTRDSFIVGSDIKNTHEANFQKPPRKSSISKPGRFYRAPVLQEHAPTNIRKKSIVKPKPLPPYIKNNKKFIPHCTSKFCSEPKKYNPISIAASEQSYVAQPPDERNILLGQYSSYHNNEVNPSDYSTIEFPMNLYIVPGMKPPSPLEKPYIYSDFQLTPANFTSQKRVFRIRRSAARLSYAEIKRPKPQKPQDNDDDDEEEEADKPHRLANVYYDTKSDMVIYKTKSPTTTEAPTFVEVDYDEVEVETTTKRALKNATAVPHRTVFHKDVMNKENGLSLLDFVEKLRGSPGYIAIPDPETTEKTTTTTISPEKTTPPEFLAFLHNLHENSAYIKYEDKDGKTEKTTTPIDTEAIEEIEEVQVRIQNSPGGQYRPIEDFEDDLNSKKVSPRTSIDYSKYKTIERSTVKNKIDEDDSGELIIRRKDYSNEDNFQEAATIEASPLKSTTSTSTTPSTTTILTTKRSNVKIRSRKRPTTTTTQKIDTTVLSRRTTRSTVRDSLSSTTQRPLVSRGYPSRRPKPKIRVRSTTPSIEREANTEEIKRTQRKLRKIHEAIPVNHKPLYTPIQDRVDSEIIQHFNYKKPRLITPDILSYNKSTKGDDVPGRISPRSYNVEVFKNYDRKQKHGGNYQRKIGGNKYESFYKINHNYDANSKLDLSTENSGGVSRSRETLEDFDDVTKAPQVKSRETLEETASESSGEVDLLGSGESKETSDKSAVEDKSKDYEFDDEVKILFNPGGNGKKVVIIKDPNRRRYFYAPV